MLSCGTLVRLAILLGLQVFLTCKKGQLWAFSSSHGKCFIRANCPLAAVIIASLVVTVVRGMKVAVSSMQQFPEPISLPVTWTKIFSHWLWILGNSRYLPLFFGFNLINGFGEILILYQSYWYSRFETFLWLYLYNFPGPFSEGRHFFSLALSPTPKPQAFPLSQLHPAHIFPEAHFRSRVNKLCSMTTLAPHIFCK